MKITYLQASIMYQLWLISTLSLQECFNLVVIKGWLGFSVYHSLRSSLFPKVLPPIIAQLHYLPYTFSIVVTLHLGVSSHLLTVLINLEKLPS